MHNPLPTPGVTPANWGQQLNDAIESFQPHADLDTLPLNLYGNSYGILAAGWFTAGSHYSQQAAAALNGGTVTSYAVSAERSMHAVISLVGTASTAKFAPVVAGAQWPGASSRPGLVVLDTLGNDIGHYPSMAADPVVPAVIASTNYTDSMRELYRAMLAVASSETRIEQTTATFVGSWTQSSPSTEYSGGSIAFTTTVGDSIEFATVTPPQSGPLAGKVFLGVATVNVATATYDVSIDGGAAVGQTVPIWESYTGDNGGNINTGYTVLPVTLPVDGAAHSVKFTHAGSGGQAMYADAIYVPSVTPPRIALMGMENPAKVAAGVFDQAGVDAWRFNMPLIKAEALAAVAEFPNAFYVPSTMTPNGLYSGDGLHPNDRGMAQRANDLRDSIDEELRAWLQNRALGEDPDGDFGII